MNTLQEIHLGAYTISTDPARLDLAAIHRYLSQESYWSRGIAMEKVARAIAHSLPYGVYTSSEQVGFGRIVTDYCKLAYICDVYILTPHRGQGLGKALVQAMLSHPELQDLRRWMLATQDAHGLYQPFGFQPVANPANLLEIRRP